MAGKYIKKRLFLTDKHTRKGDYFWQVRTQKRRLFFGRKVHKERRLFLTGKYKKRLFLVR